jgi:hypothetical protein
MQIQLNSLFPLAYIDAGVGSLALQAALGTVFAAVLAVKSVRTRVASAFIRLIGRRRDTKGSDGR